MEKVEKDRENIIKYLEDIKVFAKNNNVPIVREQTLSAILDIVKEKVDKRSKEGKKVRILELRNSNRLFFIKYFKC